MLKSCICLQEASAPRIGSRGVLGRIGCTNRDQLNKKQLGEYDADASTSEPTPLTQKAWKKHHNKNKKEKLRRLNTHLDVF